MSELLLLASQREMIFDNAAERLSPVGVAPSADLRGSSFSFHVPKRYILPRTAKVKVHWFSTGRLMLAASRPKLNHWRARPRAALALLAGSLHRDPPEWGRIAVSVERHAATGHDGKQVARGGIAAIASKPPKLPAAASRVKPEKGPTARNVPKNVSATQATTTKKRTRQDGSTPGAAEEGSTKSVKKARK